MRLGSLFAGIGGFDLAARWMGWSTAWFSEIEPYACRVLAKNFPGVPNLGDIRHIAHPPPIDMLVGGFPCQDISVAGKGAGLEGSRSGLWYEYARLVDELRPRWVVAENVSALRSRGLDRVLGSLAALGYDAEWHCIPASAVGAPHQRDRIWIVAYPQRIAAQLDGAARSLDRAARGPARARAERERDGDAARGRGAPVADANRAGLGEHGGAVAIPAEQSAAERGGVCGGGWDAASWWAAEPAVGRVADGVPARVDRLRCLGNAIVPQVAYLIFRAIANHEARRRSGLSHIKEHAQ